MGFEPLSQNNDHRKEKTDIKALIRNPRENQGITHGKEFDNEKEFQKYLANWLEGRTLTREGNKLETSKSSKRDKKEKAQVNKVELEPARESGFGDIAIHHDELDLSWNHKLANPLIIECKNKESFRYAIEQAVRYKAQSGQKYKKEGDFKKVDTAIATPYSLSIAQIAKSYEEDFSFSTNFEAKRIYWKLKIGVMQSIQDEIILSFGEADVVRIK